MQDSEKRHIADVIAGAVWSDWDDDMIAEMAARTESHVPTEWAAAWWAVMDWVELGGWHWMVDPSGAELFGNGHSFIQVRYVDGNDIGERWARLSCVTQAIEAGVLG